MVRTIYKNFKKVLLVEKNCFEIFDFSKLLRASEQAYVSLFMPTLTLENLFLFN